MKTVGQIATYPQRFDTLVTMLPTVADQLDEILVILNGYDDHHLSRLPRFSNVTFHVPKRDLKDTGKFYGQRAATDYVFLLDDDIAFPDDYVAKLIAFYERLPRGPAAIGLHGVVYSDLFDGAAQSRFVVKFDKALARPILVNQLGTGCTMVRGDLLPPFAVMKTAQRFVDIRFARYCHDHSIKLVCMPRPEAWLRDLQPEDSIFESYTRERQREQLDEILSFGGFGKLDRTWATAVERL